VIDLAIEILGEGNVFTSCGRKDGEKDDGEKDGEKGTSLIIDSHLLIR
jgi:hypothetical protein